MGKMGKMAVLIALLGFSLASQPGTGAGNERSGGCRGKRVGDDGTIYFDNRDHPKLVIAHTYLDITDVLMRLHGEDPYRLVKAKILDETRYERSERFLPERTERLRESVVQMSAYLEKVWGYTQWSAAERRLALFALWHEAAEEGDEELVTTSRMVRATINAFIRRRLPEGSVDAYSPREIEALNQQRTCKALFEPYSESAR